MLINEVNNYCELSGEVSGGVFFSHEVFGESFMTFPLKVGRLSGISDTVNVIASEKLLCDFPVKEGDKVAVKGQFRSYNNYSGVGNRLVLSAFAKIIEEAEGNDADINSVILRGFLCKEPVYRITPFGREICDILLAVNRIHNKSDYIPCIAWGKNAKEASLLKVGDHITVSGRIQSREYKKRLENGETEIKTAFEVSVSTLELSEDK